MPGLLPASRLARPRLGLDATGICVVYLCHDGNGRFVMAKRGSMTRDEQGRWDIGGGAVEFLDTVEDTLIREVQEEYGAECREFSFLDYRNVLRRQVDVTTHWLALDFLVLVDPSEVRNNEPHRFDDIGWFTRSALPSPLHSNLPFFFQKYSSALTAAGLS